MYIMGIDTSAVSASCAIVKDEKLISEVYLNNGLTHSQTLLTIIDSALKIADLKFDDINAVAVASGPGSFTGIRIGISAVKGLCFENDVACLGISTLEAMAYSVDLEGYIICPVMDARCMQVYNALFEKEEKVIKRLTEDKPKLLSELATELTKYNKKIILIGDGTDLAYDYLSSVGLDVQKFSENYKFQHASGVAFAAIKNYNILNNSFSADLLQPVYLRLSQAERELKNRSGENDSIKQ